MFHQTAGAMFASGDYGCLFKNPPPICEETGRPINANVGKIIVEGGSGQQEEVKKTALLRKIPELQEHIIVPTKVCRAAPQQTDPEWSSCFLTAQGSPLLVLGMMDGGRTLKDATQDTKWFAANFLRIAEHLLEGLVLLHANGWNHTDIHDKNILIDKEGFPRYIDFGLALNREKPNREELDKFSEYNVSLIFMPPEYHVYAMGVNGIDVPTAVNQITSQSIYARIKNLFPLSESIEVVLPRLIVNPNIVADAVTFYTHYGDKVDIWSLGLVFYRAYMFLLAVPGLQLETTKIKSLLEMMLAFDPAQRYSAAACLRRLNPQNRFLRVERLTAKERVRQGFDRVRDLAKETGKAVSIAKLGDGALATSATIFKSERPSANISMPFSFAPPSASRTAPGRRGTLKKPQKRV